MVDGGDRVEWYPLPEVDGIIESSSDSSSSLTRTCCETSQLPKPCHPTVHGPALYTPATITVAPPDLTILSTGSLPSSGRAKPYLSSTHSSVGGVSSTPSLHLPPTSLSPNELDQLWQRFLSSMFIKDQWRSSGWPVNGCHLQGRVCPCNCHQQLVSHRQPPPLPATCTPFPHYKQMPISLPSPSPKHPPPAPHLPSTTPTTKKQQTHPTYLPTGQNRPSSTKKGVAFTVAIPTASKTTGVQTTPTLMKGFSASSKSSLDHFYTTPSVTKGTSLKGRPSDVLHSHSPSHSPTIPTSVVIDPTAQDISSRLQQLSLQECCQFLKADFIHNSKLRQLRLQERAKKRATLSLEQQRHAEKRDSSKHIALSSNEGGVGFVRIVKVQPRPKMTYWQMYEQSKRYWDKLPEVKERERVEKRKEQIRTNRLRVKLYQREVLCRLKRLRRKRSS